MQISLSLQIEEIVIIKCGTLIGIDIIWWITFYLYVGLYWWLF